MNKLKKIIIFFAIVLVIIIIILLIVLVSAKQGKATVYKEGYGNEDENYEKNHVIEETVKKVDNKTEYYIIKKIIDLYFDNINLINAKPSTELEKEDSNFALETLKGMLSKAYSKEFNVTDKKILANAEKYKNCDYTIEDMYIKEKAAYVATYLVKVNVAKTGDTYFIIGLDSKNNVFEIYCDEYVKKYKYNEEIQKFKDFKIDNIEKNTFNEYSGKVITDKDIAINYFNDYKYNILNNIEKAYNLLDKEYRNKRFGSLEVFAKYIQDNIDTFRNINIEQYASEINQEYTQYICKDQNENLYIFKENAIMDYTVQLDTYTIATEKFIKEYENSNVKEKVAMNIGKFIDMINNYDYKSAYGVLNKSFKEKYFQTEEKFKQYMKNTYYITNDIDLKDFSNENGIYVYTGIMRNKFYDDADKGKELSIIMKLNDGINFEMSFEVY